VTENAHGLGIVALPFERRNHGAPRPQNHGKRTGMSDISDIHDPPGLGRLERERQRVTDSLRELAAHLDAAPKEQLTRALPIAAAAIGELRKRLSPWLR